jgi:hypothetical protein
MKMEATTMFLKKEDYLNFFENGRRPTFFERGYPQYLVMEGDLKNNAT